MKAPDARAFAAGRPNNIASSFAVDSEGSGQELAHPPARAAKLIGVPLTRFRELVKNGVIGVVPVGGGAFRRRFVVSHEELIRFLREKRVVRTRTGRFESAPLTGIPKSSGRRTS